MINMKFEFEISKQTEAMLWKLETMPYTDKYHHKYFSK